MNRRSTATPSSLPEDRLCVNIRQFLRLRRLHTVLVFIRIKYIDWQEIENYVPIESHILDDMSMSVNPSTKLQRKPDRRGWFLQEHLYGFVHHIKYIDYS